MSDFPSSLLIFGCGNMGGAMLRGWIAAGIDPARFIVVDPQAVDLPQGVKAYPSADDLEGKFDAILLGIKPQMLKDLAADIATHIAPGATLISILAGTPVATLAAHFRGAQIVRLMPNLAAALGKSPLGIWSQGDAAAVRRWLEPLGTPFSLDSEEQMDAVTALVGSGPAFVYRMIDALAAAGAEIGLTAEAAQALSVSMVEGAALLAASAGEDAATLAQRVTSKGGTTAAGLAVLDQGDALKQLMTATLRAARDRGAELAREGEKA